MRFRVCAALCAVWIGVLMGWGERALGASLVLTDLLDPELDRARVRSVLTRQLGMGVRLEPPPPVLLESLLALPPVGILEQCDVTAAQLQEAHAGLNPEHSKPPMTFYQVFQLEQELVELRLLELDLDAVDTHLQAAWKLVPCLERVLQPEEVRALFLSDATAQVIRGSTRAEARLVELIGVAPGVGLESDAPARVRRAYDKALLVASKHTSQTLSVEALRSQVWVDGVPVSSDVSIKPGRHVLQVRAGSLLVRTRVLQVPAASSQNRKPIPVQPLFADAPFTDVQAARRGLERALASGKPGHAVQGVLEAWLEQQDRTEAAFACSEAGGDTTPRAPIYRKGEGLISLQTSRLSSSSVERGNEVPEQAPAAFPVVSTAVSTVVSTVAVPEGTSAADTPGLRTGAEAQAETPDTRASAASETPGPDTPDSPSPAGVQGAAELLGEGNEHRGMTRTRPAQAAAPKKRTPVEPVRPAGPPESLERRSSAGSAQDALSVPRPSVDARAPLEGLEAGAGLRVDLPTLIGSGTVVQQGGAGIALWGSVPLGPVHAQASVGVLLLRSGSQSSDDSSCVDAVSGVEVSQAQAEFLATCQGSPPVYSFELGGGAGLDVWESLRVTPAVRGVLLSVPALLVPGDAGAPAWTRVRALAGGVRLAVGAHWQLGSIRLGLELGGAVLAVPTGTELRWLGLASLTPGVEVTF